MRTRVKIKTALLGLTALSLLSCAAGRTPGEHIADMPHWMGWAWADKPLDSPLTIDAEIHDAVMALSLVANDRNKRCSE